MRHLLFAILSIVAYCCSPPFNNFHYLDNATLLHKTIAAVNAKLDLGWAHVVGRTSPVTPWPVNGLQITFVGFCYADALTKSKLQDTFAAAWRRWHNKIGNAGPGQGHSLGGFHNDVDEKGKSLWCFMEHNIDMIWNPAIRADALVVAILPGRYGSASLTGYRPNEW
ncbi:hypothetical protein EK21DRAFT_71136 [Setomelanomma holmii]|uniref:Uncharacterized protein n=1 Tax=Setomelanomma holmii TaxID=210430 RepID=A0A9P4H3Y7_9PLEO|nr:hypothetical protein EK21DRAFT_71136 [Setomelanomma holmii]